MHISILKLDFFKNQYIYVHNNILHIIEKAYIVYI